MEHSEVTEPEKSIQLWNIKQPVVVGVLVKKRKERIFEFKEILVKKCSKLDSYKSTHSRNLNSKHRNESKPRHAITNWSKHKVKRKILNVKCPKGEKRLEKDEVVNHEKTFEMMMLKCHVSRIKARKRMVISSVGTDYWGWGSHSYEEGFASHDVVLPVIKFHGIYMSKLVRLHILSRCVFLVCQFSSDKPHKVD